MDELFHRDPNGAMLAFSDMMRKQIVMPAHLMNDLVHEPKNDGRNLFADFSDVAQRLGVYTAQDYAGIMEHLVKRHDFLSLLPYLFSQSSIGLVCKHKLVVLPSIAAGACVLRAARCGIMKHLMKLTTSDDIMEHVMKSTTSDL